MEKKKILSVAIAVYNEEKNLEACLASVRQLADEIVVVDGGSADRTVEIAKKFTTNVICTGNPAIFHINKQKALDVCTGDWILQLDADEIITEGLKKEILEVIHDTGLKMNGYYIPRKNYFWGHWMHKGGQYPDYVMRLVRRGKAHFPAKSVHEQIEVDGKAGYLIHPMYHISYRSKEEYWRKADAYTTLTAMEMKKNGVPKNAWTWFIYNIVKPKITFLSLFIRHKGFMDGWYGLVFAYFSALHFPAAYKKYTALLQKNV
ncbi:MAG: glycosyltransferase family 2 protein [Candidatus Gottesmanbacteria bacterium]|nr:glycosyltransferase family 2 protein [Candidatus Gottesmanbacteria bacterium]